MRRFPSLLGLLIRLPCTLLILLVDTVRFLLLCLRSSPALAAENLFLRKQLALYQERYVKPRRATNTTQMALIWLCRWFDWRRALAIVQPATLIRRHRQGFRLFWRWTSSPGRPPIPSTLQARIRRTAWENPSWGEERIANELLLKLGLRVSPQTVRQYLPKRLDRGRGGRAPLQRWRTFVRNRAQAIVSCDFCMVVTATFRLLYVFVAREHLTRRLLHEWVCHYNAGRPHMALGPGIPQPPPSLSVPLQAHRHRLPAHLHVVARSILGGFHHEYWLEAKVA